MCSECSHVKQVINMQKFTHTSIHIPVDDAGTIPAGPTVLNVLSGPVRMSSVEKHRNDISGVKE